MRLEDLLSILENIKTDIILVEGFKKENFPKIELYRKAIGKEILFYNDSNIVAIASDENIKIENNIHKLDLNDPQQIVDYIINFLSLNK